MAPIEVSAHLNDPAPAVTEDPSKSRNQTALNKSGVLDSNFSFEETTPAIGREYPTAQIVEDFLNAPNADDLLRDLAITSKPTWFSTQPIPWTN